LQLGVVNKEHHGEHNCNSPEDVEGEEVETGFVVFHTVEKGLEVIKIILQFAFLRLKPAVL
jgi:hypothetical protein